MPHVNLAIRTKYHGMVYPSETEKTKMQKTLVIGSSKCQVYDSLALPFQQKVYFEGKLEPQQSLSCEYPRISQC